MNWRKTKAYKNMTVFYAAEIMGGWGMGEDASEVEVMAAWQFGVDNEMYRWMEGTYGRTMWDMIANGDILPPK